MPDILIIGGGIAGISAAARLSHIGKVTLLEAEKNLAYHASGRSAAMFEENYGSPAVVALNRASRDYLTLENGGVLSPRGFLLVAKAHEKATFDADCRAMQLAPIDPAQALKSIPILNKTAIEYAAFHKGAMDLDTDLLCQNFIREARTNGASFLTDHPVSKIRHLDGQWQVESKHGGFSAPVLVNAAGAWADQVASLAGVAPIRLTPLRRSMARVSAPEGLDVSSWPMLFGPGESWYCKPDAGALLISPADETPCDPHDAWPEDLDLATGIDQFQSYVDYDVHRLISSWAGLRSFAPDRCLVIGFDATAPGFFWLAGQGGYGFQTAPAASQLAADLIAGQPPELEPGIVKALSPTRF